MTVAACCGRHHPGGRARRGGAVMTTARVERRLAAILAADVVGYSRLMERDEDRTLARLKELRTELVEPLIAEYQGRIVKLMGDGAAGRVRERSRRGALRRARPAGHGRARGAGGRSRAHPVPDRHQPRRRDPRGRRRPLRRRGERCRAAGATRRARRGGRVGHRLRPAPRQARPHARLRGRAAGQEHRAAGPRLPGAARREGGTVQAPLPRVAASVAVRWPRCSPVLLARRGGRRLVVAPGRGAAGCGQASDRGAAARQPLRGRSDGAARRRDHRGHSSPTSPGPATST